MKFKEQKKETVILNPMQNMEQNSILSEIRMDPLTGRTARICHFMKLHWEKPDIKKLVAGTEAICPFCPGKVLKVTPCFPEDIVPQGRMISGDMILFPNIAPYDSIGAVASMGSRHYIPMTEFTRGHIQQAFQLAMEFFRRIEEIKHPEGVYHLINWNYMPVAGSSLVHPHLQVFSTSSAPNLMREELAAAKNYMQANGSNYWEDLVGQETVTGERFLARIGRSTWLSTYAPMGIAGDILAVVDDVRCTLELTDKDLSDISEGLVRAMAAYDRMGIYSFNMSFFSGASSDDFARVHLIFSPRTYFNQALGAPDINALRHLYNETLCMEFPEKINAMLKPYFSSY